MSNIRALEPQAYGKIIFKTTFGDIELELFTQQCPKNTRNFVQLCLEGYYEGTIFDRIEKDFIAIGGKKPEESQTHDDNEFDIAPDEFHPRLKFARRGLLATANTEKDTNGPAFFFTLGPAPELQNRHTIFGRLIGDSVYRLVDLNECHVDDNMVPVSEKVITQVIVVDNPYTELKPRSDFVQALKKSQIKHELEDLKPEEDDGYLKPKFDFKNSKKLSFYEESESEDEDEVHQDENTDSQFKVPQSMSHKHQDDENPVESEIITNETKQVGSENLGLPSSEEAREKRLHEIREQIKNFKEQLLKESATKIRTLTERKRTSEEQDSSHNVTIESKASSSKQSSIDDPDLANQELRLATKKGRHRERETIELMQQFKKKLKETVKTESSSISISKADYKKSNSSAASGTRKPDARETDVDNEDDEIQHLDDVLDLVDGDDWLRHKFDAKGTGDASGRDASAKGDDWYLVDDPRAPMSSRPLSDSERARDNKSHSRRRDRHDNDNDDDNDNVKSREERRRHHHHDRDHHNRHEWHRSSTKHSRESSASSRSKSSGHHRER